jgi:hypothetical protein
MGRKACERDQKKRSCFAQGCHQNSFTSCCQLSFFNCLKTVSQVVVETVSQAAVKTAAHAAIKTGNKMLNKLLLSHILICEKRRCTRTPEATQNFAQATDRAKAQIL